MRARCTAPFARGFTLVELLVVLAILGVLAGLVMPLGHTLLIAQKERELRMALQEIRGAIDAYKKFSDRSLGLTSQGAVSLSTASGYPPTLQALADGVNDTSAATGGRMVYFLRRVPRDPFADASVPAELTWKLRSYASSASRPEPGADVYDVHSSSTAQALDGSWYAQW
ncbi:PulG Type II secretory pathway, pseudopilin PulG [Comamonadaceae bacterium]